jgi:DNA-binding CsgD family transcriptional regulator
MAAVLSGNDVRVLGDCIRKVYASADLATYRAETARVAAALVSADMVTYNEIGLAPGEAYTVEHPAGALSEEERVRFHAHVGEHPILRHMRATGDRRAVRISDLISVARFRRLALYNEFFRRVGVEDQLAIGVDTPPPVLVGVAWNRGRRSFSERDKAVLDLVRPHLDQARRRAVELEGTLDALAACDGHAARGVLRIDCDGVALQGTELAWRLLRRELGGPPRQLPPVVRAWARAQLGGLAQGRAPATLTTGRLHLRCLPERTGRGAVLLVEEEHGLEPLRRLGLTRRQADVLSLLTRGKTNGEVALILGLALGTVKKHLEHIYALLGVETRAAAVLKAAQVLGF